MAYVIEIKQDDKTICNGGVSADAAVRILIAIMNQKAAEAGDVQYVNRGKNSVSPSSGRRPYKKRGKYKKHSPLDSEVMEEAARRHPATEQIEVMLIDGKTTSEVVADIEVSRPTVGVIAARLTREGRLTMG